ncbi:MAG TPA: hypothetical protein VLJ37_02145 [bacterium]|nr:hypothetical protein [bacterium]
MRNPKAGIFRDRGAFEALTAGDCGARYRKVEAGESDFLDRTLKMCTDLAPPRGALMVMTPSGFTPVTDGYLCVGEGSFPKKVDCPAEAPFFVGVSAVWYGCIRPASTPPPQIETTQTSCIDGFSLKSFGESWGYICVDDQDEYGDLVDRAEDVCGKPSAEIAFAGFAENPNRMIHCCALRRDL